MTTPTDLRALAARVLGEEPSDEVQDAVLIACGWSRPAARASWHLKCPKGTLYTVPPNPLTSHDAAFGAMPAGWMVSHIAQDAGGFYVELYPIASMGHLVNAAATDLPRAVTAAGLLARAAEMEAGTMTEKPFPQPRRKDGGEPCGECHIQPGETCDICGATMGDTP